MAKDSWSPTAEQIKTALATHHSKDVFVDECKNGPTWTTTGLARMDAWVLCRTWSPMTIIGYEIKVSRADFEQDQKWTAYLPLCHAFYFACPAGLIRSTDLPKGVGLKWYSKAGNIHTKLRAERHEPDPEKLNQLLIYVLMCRSKITKEPQREEPDHLAAIKEIVETAEKKKELASIVSGHIQMRYVEMMKQVQEARWKEEAAQRFREQLAQIGISWDPEKNSWDRNEQVSRQIQELRKDLLDRWDLAEISTLGDRLTKFATKMEALQERLKVEAGLVKPAPVDG